MPELKGITVHVTSDGKELKEWGSHYLRARNKVSTFVESTTDQAFQITIQARLPWPDPDSRLLRPGSAPKQLSNDDNGNVTKVDDVQNSGEKIQR